MPEFIKIVGRIKALLSLRHDQEVAKLLGLTKSAFSERKRRDSLPADKVAILCKNESINADWIMTGRGWAYNPPTSEEALNWMRRRLMQDIRRIVIVTYKWQGVVIRNGFLLETPLGIISMSGAGTTSGYKGAGPRHYDAILRIIQRMNIPTAHVTSNEKDDLLSATDLSTMLGDANFHSGSVDREIEKLGIDSPISEKNTTLEEEKATVHAHNAERALLLEKAQKILTEGDLAQRALLRGTIEEIYLELLKNKRDLDSKAEMDHGSTDDMTEF